MLGLGRGSPTPQPLPAQLWQRTDGPPRRGQKRPVLLPVCQRRIWRGGPQRGSSARRPEKRPGHRQAWRDNHRRRALSKWLGDRLWGCPMLPPSPCPASRMGRKKRMCPGLWCPLWSTLPNLVPLPALVPVPALIHGARPGPAAHPGPCCPPW